MVQLQQHLKQLKVNKKLNISEYPILGNLVISDKFNISAGTKKKIMINGNIYNSISEASSLNNIERSLVRYRLKSNNFIFIYSI